MRHTIQYRSSSARRRGLGMAELLISLAITSLLLLY
jgi:Tfp pilus assembly protein PilW